MKKNKFNPMLFFWVLVIVVLVSVTSLMAQDNKFALLVQKSPEYGGVVTPSESLSMPNGDQLVTITATPRDGYEFVYWLGDVASPTSSITSVLVDTPKMVIAVFERPEFQAALDVPGGGGGGGGGGSSSSPSPGHVPSNSGSSSGPGSAPSRTYSAPEPKVLVNIPEPATMLILGSGALMLFRSPRKRR